MARRRSPGSLNANPERAPGAKAEVDSLRRGLDVLRLFDARHRSLGIAEIATKLGLSRVTATKLVATLEQQNFLRASGPDGGYESHVACLALGRAVKRGLPVLRAAGGRMAALSQQFGVHVTLSTRDGTNMLVVEHVVPTGHVRLGLGTGTRLPMVNSASGRAYLWAQAEPLRTRLLDLVRQEEGEPSFRLLSNVFASFQELEERGWCFFASPVSSQTSSIATPIRTSGQQDYVLAAMAVGFDVEQKLREAVAPELLRQTQLIAEDLDVGAGRI